MIDEKEYSVEETATLLGVTPQTIYLYINEKKMKAVKIGRKWRIAEKEILYIKENGLRG